MRVRPLAILCAAALAVLAFSVVSAQSTGQLWVRLDQDLNANGQRDAGEPLLTRGAAVSLRNASGAVIATGLQAQALVSGGVDGVVYQLTCTVNAANSEVHQIIAKLAVSVDAA